MTKKSPMLQTIESNEKHTRVIQEEISLKDVAGISAGAMGIGVGSWVLFTAIGDPQDIMRGSKDIAIFTSAVTAFPPTMYLLQKAAQGAKYVTNQGKEFFQLLQEFLGKSPTVASRRRMGHSR